MGVFILYWRISLKPLRDFFCSIFFAFFLTTHVYKWLNIVYLYKQTVHCREIMHCLSDTPPPFGLFLDLKWC